MKEALSRSERRHHLARIKKKRSHYYGFEKTEDDKVFKRFVGMVARTAALCSCHMCGNERRVSGEKTVHELSHERLHKTEK